MIHEFAINPKVNLLESQLMINNFIKNVSFVIRSSYHTMLQARFGADIFGRDMHFGVSFIAD